MSLKIAQQDIYITNPEYPAARILVARKGGKVAARYADMVEVAALADNAPAVVGANGTGSDAGKYDDLNAAELKKLVKARGLEPETGRKADCIAALEADDEAPAAPAGDVVVDYDGHTDEELLQLVVDRDVETDGDDRETLIAALLEADANAAQ